MKKPSGNCFIILWTLFVVGICWFIWRHPSEKLKVDLITTSTSEPEAPLLLDEPPEETYDPLEDSTIEMDDPRLLAAIREILVPPSTLSYNFTNMSYADVNVDPSAGQTQLVQDILKSFGPNGFFIDCGANDGEWFSNTIWPERTLGWKGLLIEADSVIYEVLETKHRNAWLGQFCLSTNPYPGKMKFTSDRSVMAEGYALAGRIAESGGDQVVQCLPLYSVLLAVNRTTVDYFSLDVEGAEIDILKTVPFDKVTFKVVTLETFTTAAKTKALEFMASIDYVFFQSIHVERPPWHVANDCIFLHKSVELTEEQKARLGTHVKG